MRQGAFASLRGVKLYAQSVRSLLGPEITSGAPISTPAYFAIIFTSGISPIYLSEMPVFTPNEYFWKHHWDGKEEKWMAFARAVRQVIANELGVPTSESSLREKFEYKAMMRGSKKKPTADQSEKKSN
jgi:hypothetical protein